jgi:Tol biopolymer transport system component
VSSSETEERPDSATTDGRFVTFQQQHASARLWRLAAGAREATSITNDALSDFAPSASPDGKTAVFQRHAGSPSLGITLLDSQLFVLRTNNAGVQSMSMSVPAGFQPRVSPGGAQVAYFARQSSGARFASLFVKDLSTGQIRTVSNQCPLPGYAMAPVEWSHQNMAWAPDGSLFFVEQGDAGSLIRKFDPINGSVSTITNVMPTRVVDLYPSRDGRELAYLLNHDGNVFVRRRDLASGHEQLVHQSRGRLSATSLRGWSHDGGLILVRRHIDVPDERWPVMEVAHLMPGVERRVGMVDRAHAFTARLSPDGSVLYYTGAESRASNIYALLLARGTTRRLTSNQLPSTMFSGIEPLADGSLIYAQDDRRQDIWLSRTSPKRSGQ